MVYGANSEDRNMSTKSKLMDEINKKAARIKEMRQKAIGNKHLQAFAFDFFKEVDSVHSYECPQDMKIAMVTQAFNAFKTKLKSIDSGADTSLSVDDVGNITGIKVFWSSTYATSNKIDKEQTIDVTEMLLSETM